MTGQAVVKYPKWFDETAQFGFFNPSGNAAIIDMLEKGMLEDYGKIDQKRAKGIVMIQYGFDPEKPSKASLVFDVCLVTTNPENQGGKFDRDALFDVLSAFDWAFGSLYESIVS